MAQGVLLRKAGGCSEIDGEEGPAVSKRHLLALLLCSLLPWTIGDGKLHRRGLVQQDVESSDPEPQGPATARSAEPPSSQGTVAHSGPSGILSLTASALDRPRLFDFAMRTEKR